MKRVLVIVLFAIAVGLTYVSLNPYNTALLLLAVPLVLLFFGILMAFFLSSWQEGEEFKERFRKALNQGLILSASFYILGYIFVIVESLIR
jgi:cell division protein FtsW (lipid II flippase)